MGEQERRGWVPAPYRGTGQAFRRYDGWGSPLRWDGGEGEGMGSRLRGNDDWGGRPWVPAPYQVRGRLFAGRTVGGCG